MGANTGREVMIYLKDFRQGRLLYEALDSDVRLGILEELLENKELNLAYFAKRFDGLQRRHHPRTSKSCTRRGSSRSPRPQVSAARRRSALLPPIRSLSTFSPARHEEGLVESASIDVGQYADYEAHPTCGLATREHIVGRFDDPACFSYPERFRAGIVWMAYGYVEYLIPNYISEGAELAELQISLEIASEAPGYVAYYPATSFFSLNGMRLGVYQSKGEYNDRTGTVSPSWWFGNLGQYGKKLSSPSTNSAPTSAGRRFRTCAFPILPSVRAGRSASVSPFPRTPKTAADLRSSARDSAIMMRG